MNFQSSEYSSPLLSINDVNPVQCKNPHLPQNTAHDIIISSEISKYDANIAQNLKSCGVNPIFLQPCSCLPKPVKSHPDMCALKGAKGEWFSFKNAGEIIKSTLPAAKIKEIKLEDFPQSSSRKQNILEYPHDAALDCLQIAKHLFCGRGTPEEVISDAKNSGIQIHFCRQGYVKCSCCIVGNAAIITEDKSIADLLKDNGFDVLLIKRGEIALPGYNCGFIGGAGFKISYDTIAFFGCIEEHCDFVSIKSFCINHGVSCISLSKSKLTDFGGAICLTEKKN